MINFNECLEKYLDPQKPVCREERQIALFLYQKLFDMIGKTKEDMKNIDKSYTRVREACDLSDTDIIKSVYYEVTFMRDFQYECKEQKSSTFNDKLFEFTKEIFKNDLKDLLLEELESFGNIKCNGLINYGSRANNIESKPIKKFLRAMMNSKPDLGIIYKKVEENKFHLKFIECKYESDEGYVKLKDDYDLSQTVIQYYISKFVSEYLLNNNVQADFPILLRFIKENENSKNGKPNKKDTYESIEEILVKINENSLGMSDLIPTNMRELNMFTKTSE